MNRQQLEISKIVVQDRQRGYNEAHVSSLADSLKALGLIQPVVLNQENRLIAGGHRLAAAIKLPMDDDLSAHPLRYPRLRRVKVRIHEEKIVLAPLAEKLIRLHHELLAL